MFVVAFTAAGRAVAAGPVRLGSVHDACGILSTNTVSIAGTTYRHVSAGGQAGGVFTASGGAWTNCGGYLHVADSKNPAVDTDGDGIPDEWDSDNDNDGLADADEIGGYGFTPRTPTDVNLADTDGDGMPDGVEAGAGTDPTDPDALLRIVAVDRTDSGPSISWLARSLKTYEVYAMDDMAGYPGSKLDTVVAPPGGAGPWEVTTNTLTDATFTNAAVRFYYIRVP